VISLGLAVMGHDMRPCHQSRVAVIEASGCIGLIALQFPTTCLRIKSVGFPIPRAMTDVRCQSFASACANHFISLTTSQSFPSVRLI
jgi:hypothetical protein